MEDYLEYAKATTSQTTMIHARYWTQAAKYQANRLLSTSQRVKDIHMFTSIALMEEQFLLNAIGKAIRWLDAFAEQNNEPELKTLVSQLSDWKTIRCMREHDDEYLLGGGTHRDKQMKTVVQPGKTTLNVGPGVTIHRDGDILLGGRISVKQALIMATVVSAYRVKKERGYWESRRGDKLASFTPPSDLLD